MATIIPLNAVRSERPTAPPLPKEGAEIVIFPGVRYARIPEPQPVAQAAASGERDLLVLPE